MSKLDNIVFYAMTGSTKLAELLPMAVSDFIATAPDAPKIKQQIKDFILALAEDDYMIYDGTKAIPYDEFVKEIESL